MGKLEDLASEIKTKHGNDGFFIDYRKSESKLYLIMDLNEGVEGCEATHINEGKEGYEFVYCAHFSVAFDTILNEKRKIPASTTLSELRRLADEEKRKLDVEVYDNKTKKIYSKLIFIRIENQAYEDVRSAALFIADTLKDKVKSHQALL